MGDSELILKSSFSLLRRRFIPLCLITAGSFSLVPILILIFALVILSQPGARGLSPTELWTSAGAMVKITAFFIFLIMATLPRDLTEAGIVIAAWADERGEEIRFGTVVTRIANALLRLIPISLVLGFLTIALSSTFVLPVVIGVACALVMPLIATTRLRGWRALRVGFTLCRSRLRQVLTLYAATLAVMIPALLVFLNVFLLAAERPGSAFEVRLLLVLLLLFLAVLVMLRSVFLALIYLGAVKKSALEPSAKIDLELVHQEAQMRN